MEHDADALVHDGLQRAEVGQPKAWGDEATAVLVEVLVPGREKVVLVVEFEPLVNNTLGVVSRHQDLLDYRGLVC